MLHAVEIRRTWVTAGGLTGVRGSALLGERGGVELKRLVLENRGEHWSIVITKKQTQLAV